MKFLGGLSDSPSQKQLHYVLLLYMYIRGVGCVGYLGDADDGKDCLLADVLSMRCVGRVGHEQQRTKSRSLGCLKVCRAHIYCYTQIPSSLCSDFASLGWFD